MIKSTLMDFQSYGINRVHRVFDGRAIIADEVGLGKSVQALAYCDRYVSDDPLGPIVVVCPAHLKINWRNEVRKHLGVSSTVLYGQRVPDDYAPPMDQNGVIIINDEVLCPPHWKPRTAPPEDSWLVWLLALKPRVVILDEGHRYSNTGTARTRAARKLARKVEKTLILTGTPISNKPFGLWSLLNIVRPDLYPSRHEFASTYSYGRRHWWGWEYKGARNLDELHASLCKNVMIRRRKADVLDQLPAVTYSVVPIEVDLREYHKAEADFVGWLRHQSPLMAKSAAKAEELNKLGALKRLAGRLKIDGVVGWTNSFLEESDGKLLLGALHYAVTEPLMKAFGKDALLVDGRLTDKKKNESFDSFNKTKRHRILVGNLNAAGTGWSCTATSDVAVCELPWVPGDLVQFAGRVHGISRGVVGDAAHVRLLVSAGTCEEDLCKILQLKNQWSDQAIDGIPNSHSLPVHDLVVALIKTRAQAKRKKAS